MRILYLTVSVGGGHIKAAEAVKESFLIKYPDSKHMVVDALKYINPILDKLVVGGYLSTIKKTPQLYRMIYERSETGENIYDFSSRVSQLLSYKMRDLIEEFMPDAIVCTHPFSLQLISKFKVKREIKVPILAVLTDFSVHSFWIYDFIDAYIVAHEHMKYDMIKRGISEDLIFPYGIPVAAKFAKKKDRDKLLVEFGLTDKKHIALIMGGSLGYGKMVSSFSMLMETERDIQVIAITGKNAKQEREFKRLSSVTNKRVEVVSYTDRVEDYMEVSDFIITKPGGMTLAESLVKGLPIFIISPIPGHEEGNARFLLNMGCAIRVWSHSDFDLLIKETIENPLRLRHIKEMASYLAKPYAAENVVALIEKMI